MNDNYPIAYACYNLDLDVRLHSTSGGIFTILATYVIDDLGGVVFGAAFDNDFKVIHICVEETSKLGALRGSKYPQSAVQDIFKDVRAFLNNNRYVLFTGTPCQVQALKNFLGREYEKLFCMDFVCHGVASNGIWKDYVDRLREDGEIKHITFKSKPFGWKKWYFRVEYNSHVYQRRGSMNEFMKSYLTYANIRPSCYNCVFKGLAHVSDFTISDCWGIAEQDSEINDNKGLSALLIQNEKAYAVFNRIKNNLEYKEYPAQALMKGNWTAFKCVSKSPIRAQLFEYSQVHGGWPALKKYYKPRIWSWLHYYYRKIIGVEK